MVSRRRHARQEENAMGERKKRQRASAEAERASPVATCRTTRSVKEKRKERDEMLDGQLRTPLFSVAKQKTDMCGLLLRKL